MTAVLNHTIVAVSDRHRGAAFLAGLLGLEVGPEAAPFTPVRINDDLTFDFDDRLGGRVAHYAFLVDDDTFDRALGWTAGADSEWELPEDAEAEEEASVEGLTRASKVVFSASLDDPLTWATSTLVRETPSARSGR